MLEIVPVPALQDNYIWLIRHENKVAIVDPGESQPVLDYCEVHQLSPCAILITHHHWDHTNGIADLLDTFSVPVYGPAKEDINGLSNGLGEGDTVQLSELAVEFSILDVPGHTRGAITYVGHGVAFTGDTLFLAGCGRLFEGTAEQMHQSLNKIKSLADDTLIYCGHEYTEANLNFALAVEPENAEIKERLKLVDKQMQSRTPTVPATLALEKATNPFLRTEYEHIQHNIEQYCGKTLSEPAEVFAELRRWKDNF